MDLGLSLMASPHSSYPPLDLAAAGAVVVTNTFGAGQAIARAVLGEHHLQRPGTSPSLIAGIGQGVALGAGRASAARANHRNSSVRDRLERGLRADLRSTRGCARRDRRRSGWAPSAAPPEFPDPWAPSIEERVRTHHRCHRGTRSRTCTRCPTRAPFAIASSTWSRRSARTTSTERISATWFTRAELPILERLIGDVQTRWSSAGRATRRGFDNLVTRARAVRAAASSSTSTT